MTQPLQEIENLRLGELERLGILDTPEDPDFNGLVHLASLICETPVSLISLVDADRQWFKAEKGLGIKETARAHSFCAHALENPFEPFIVKDARVDLRFHSNPLVTGKPNIVFYAGVPMVSEKGLALGSLCVIDKKPRILTDEQIKALRELSKQAINLIELRLRCSQELKIRKLEENKNHLYKKAISASKIGGWEVDENTMSVYWSSMTREILEVPQNFVPDVNSINALVKSEDSLVKLNSALKSLTENGTAYDIEVEIETKIGTSKWIRLIGDKQKSGAGTWKYYGSLQDVTEQAKIRQKLIANEQNQIRLATFYKSLVENNAFYIVITDLEGKTTFLNQHYAEDFKLDKSREIGMNSLHNVHPEDQVECSALAQRCIQNPSESYFITIRKFKDDQMLFSQWSFKSILDDEGQVTGILAIGQDVSDLVEKQQNLQNLVDLAADQNHRLRNFTYIVSHNIRSHVANLVSLTDLVDHTKEDGHKLYYPLIRKSVYNLEETIQHVNNILNIQTNVNLPLQRIDIKKEIVRVAEGVYEQIRHTNSKIEYILKKPVFLQTNLAYFDSIVLNMITNAIKYKHPERDAKITIIIQKEEHKIILLFKDNGLGMDLNRIGNKLFGMYKTFHGNADARGLGLFITKAQTEALGGTIEVESKPGVGTIFKLIFNEKN